MADRGQPRALALLLTALCTEIGGAASAPPPALSPRSHEWLPVDAVKPRGWLLTQAQIQADTLGGHLQVFWLEDSKWLGGSKCRSALCEEVPYWLNGVLPLAVQLDSAELMDVVHRWVGGILDLQQADGWMGPGTANGTDPASTPWSRYRILSALGMYADLPGADPRTVGAMRKLVGALHSKLSNLSVGDMQGKFPWAHSRWQELVYNAQWLVDRANGDDKEDVQALLDTMRTAQSRGLNWQGWFASRLCENSTDTKCFPCRSFSFPKECEFAGGRYFCQHGVNVAQSLTAFGVEHRLTGNPAGKDLAKKAVVRLDTCHGQLGGVWSAHEELGGIEPNCGTETCAVVETMNTVAELFSYFGDTEHLDRVEEAAFNRLPASYFNGSMWALTYFHQTNTFGGSCNQYGLPYECCVANGNQGWPKFISRLYARRADGDLAAIMYAPSVLNTTLESNGATNQVHITLDTKYPFSGGLHFTIDAQAAFKLWLRIPGWADGAIVQFGRGASVPAPAGGFYPVDVLAGATEVDLILPMDVRIKQEAAGGVSVHAGPLVFALDLAPKEKVSKSCYLPPDGCGVDSIDPTENWRTALILDKADYKTGGLAVEWPNADQDLTDGGPFSSVAEFPRIRAVGATLSDEAWPLATCTSMESHCKDCVGPVPNLTSLYCERPIVTDRRPITLRPFGATDVRIGIVPTMWYEGGASEVYV